MIKKKLISFIIILIALVFFVGCTEQENTPDFENHPTITFFSTDDIEITPGTTVNLSWSIENVSFVSIEPGFDSLSSQGSVEVQPNETTTYTLTAKNDQGQVTEDITIIITDSYNEGTPVFSITKGQNYLLITYTEDNLLWSNVLLNGNPITEENVENPGVTWDGYIHMGDRITQLSETVELHWVPTSQSLGTWYFSIE